MQSPFLKEQILWWAIDFSQRWFFLFHSFNFKACLISTARFISLKWGKREEVDLQSTGRTDAEAEAPILWPPDTKSQLTTTHWYWGYQEKGVTEDEVVGWHHLLNGHEFEQAPGDSGRQGSLAFCNSWSHKELDTNEWLNWIDWSLGCCLEIQPLFYYGQNNSWLTLTNHIYWTILN